MDAKGEEVTDEKHVDVTIKHTAMLEQTVEAIASLHQEIKKLDRRLKIVEEYSNDEEMEKFSQRLDELAQRVWFVERGEDKND